MEEDVIVYYQGHDSSEPIFYLIPKGLREEFITWVEWVLDTHDDEDVWDGTDFHKYYYLGDISKILIRDYEKEII